MPQKVLSRVPPPPKSPPRLSTPTFSSPLQNPNLTSSPTENPAMVLANSDTQQHAANRSILFDTPARTHVVRIVRSLKRS
jgi:hypothetical protein